MDVFLSIIGVILFFIVYVATSLFCERYFGFNLLFVMSHRALKEYNANGIALKFKVVGFAAENPEIYKAVIETMKRKRYAISYTNIDHSICQYIKQNPFWAEDDYQKNLAIYNAQKKIEEEKNLKANEEIRQEFLKSWCEKGFDLNEGKKFLEENPIMARQTISLLTPRKKTY